MALPEETAQAFSMQEDHDEFCLKWHDFENSISYAFSDLRKNDHFLDVTIVCQDFTEIEPHKVVLGACSPFFREILSKTRNYHPLLFLKGVHNTDMESLLDFMYNGEVNVKQSTLNRLLDVAKDLQVKGLYQVSKTLSKERDKKARNDEQPYQLKDSHNDEDKGQGLARKTKNAANKDNAQSYGLRESHIDGDTGKGEKRQRRTSYKDEEKDHVQYYQLRETHHDDSKEHKELLIGEKSKDQGLNPKEGSTKDLPAQPNPSAHRVSVIKRRVPFPTTEAGDQAVQDEPKCREEGHCPPRRQPEEHRIPSGSGWTNLDPQRGQSFAIGSSRPLTGNGRQTKPEPGLYMCKTCKKSFTNRKSMHNHRAMHLGKTTCGICTKVLSTTTNLHVHMRNTHSDSQYLVNEETPEDKK